MICLSLAAMAEYSSAAHCAVSVGTPDRSGDPELSSDATGGPVADSGDSAVPIVPEGSADDIERERDDPNEITRPFDPEKIRVRTVPILVAQIVSRIAHQEIDLAPDFQRASGIWNDRQQSRLIESLMLRIPIPVFYVAADKKERWSVVDGVQRISTLGRFMNKKFRLKKLEYLTAMENKSFEELPRHLQRRINETQLVVHVIEPGTPEEVMFNIFRRINTGGLPLTAQEIRHAMYPGPVRRYLKDLAGSESFLRATTNSVRSNRMDDREFVLRFLAFYIAPWQAYTANNIDGLFNETMVKINNLNPDTRDEIKREFEKSMDAASLIFKDDAFRKRYDLQESSRYPVNRALFETWSVTLARCTDSDINSLVQRNNIVRECFVDLMKNNREFNESISYSTGTPARVRTRFQAINDLVERSLLC